MPSAELLESYIESYPEAEPCPGSGPVNTITCSPRHIPLAGLSSLSSTPLMCCVLSLYHLVLTPQNNAPIILFLPKLPPLTVS